MYEIGSSSGITPGTTSDLPEEEEEPEPPASLIPGQEVPTQAPNGRQTSDPEPGGITTPDHVTAPPTYTFRPTTTSPDPGYRANQTQTTSPSPVRTMAQTAGPSHPPVEAEPQDPDLVEAEPRYTDPEAVRPAQVVVVDEDLDVDGRWWMLGGGWRRPDSGSSPVFSYSLQTCANNVHRCSAFADCRDHSRGYCCRCRPGFYGNGKTCLAEGACACSSAPPSRRDD